MGVTAEAAQTNKMTLVVLRKSY